MLRLPSAPRSIATLLAALLFSALGVSAQAQTSVYAAAALTDYGVTTSNENTNASLKGLSGGLTGGAFYNFPIQSRVTVGLDGRASYSPGSKGGFLGGAALRVGFVPHHVPLRPYFQLGGGVISTPNQRAYVTATANGNVISTTVENRVTSGAAQFLIGLDIRLNDHYDLRLPEYGAMAGGSGQFAVVSFVNVGAVYHFHR